jgi:hypothetical protein
MYNPEFRYLIARDNGEMEPFINTDNLIFVINACIFIFISIVLFKTVSFLCFPVINEIWNLLALGNHWLELVAFVCLIFIGGMLHLIMGEIANKIEITIAKLKEKIKEKDSRIAKPELELHDQKTNKELDAITSKLKEVQDREAEFQYSTSQQITCIYRPLKIALTYENIAGDKKINEVFIDEADFTMENPTITYDYAVVPGRIVELKNGLLIRCDEVEMNADTGRPTLLHCTVVS